jgi:hypothetical protein
MMRTLVEAGSEYIPVIGISTALQEWEENENESA